MKNKNFGQCYVCWSFRQEGIKDRCSKRSRLPRKKKKVFAQLNRTILSKINIYMNEPCSQSLGRDYKEWSKYIHAIDFLEKHSPQIKRLIKWADYVGEDIRLEVDPQTRDFYLGWFWEYDDDFCGQSGVMRFIYSEDRFDDTWSGDETKNMFERFKIPFGTVNNDRDFLRLLRTVPVGVEYS